VAVRTPALPTLPVITIYWFSGKRSDDQLVPMQLTLMPRGVRAARAQGKITPAPLARLCPEG
jgi:hypothetical protein